MFYKIGKVIVRFLLFFVFRIEVKGVENIPESGGAIMVMNHKSNWDVPIASVVSSRKLRFMAKSEMFKTKIGNWFFTSLGAFPVQRGKGDIGAIKAAITKLREEEMIAMFPEGRRMKEGQKSEPKPGAVMLSLKARVPLIPTHLEGNYKWMGKIKVTFGEPIYYTELYEEKVPVEDLQEMSNILMDTINSL